MYLKLKSLRDWGRPQLLVPLRYPRQHCIAELFLVDVGCGPRQLVLVGEHQDQLHPLQVHVSVRLPLLVLLHLLSFLLHGLNLYILCLFHPLDICLDAVLTHCVLKLRWSIV